MFRKRLLLLVTGFVFLLICTPVTSADFSKSLSSDTYHFSKINDYKLDFGKIYFNSGASGSVNRLNWQSPQDTKITSNPISLYDSLSFADDGFFQGKDDLQGIVSKKKNAEVFIANDEKNDFDRFQIGLRQNKNLSWPGSFKSGSYWAMMEMVDMNAPTNNTYGDVDMTSIRITGTTSPGTTALRGGSLSPDVPTNLVGYSNTFSKGEFEIHGLPPGKDTWVYRGAYSSDTSFFMMQSDSVPKRSPNQTEFEGSQLFGVRPAGRLSTEGETNSVLGQFVIVQFASDTTSGLNVNYGQVSIQNDGFMLFKDREDTTPSVTGNLHVITDTFVRGNKKDSFILLTKSNDTVARIFMSDSQRYGLGWQFNRSTYSACDPLTPDNTCQKGTMGTRRGLLLVRLGNITKKTVSTTDTTTVVNQQTVEADIKFDTPPSKPVTFVSKALGSNNPRNNRPDSFIANSLKDQGFDTTLNSAVSITPDTSVDTAAIRNTITVQGVDPSNFGELIAMIFEPGTGWVNVENIGGEILSTETGDTTITVTFRPPHYSTFAVGATSGSSSSEESMCVIERIGAPDKINQNIRYYRDLFLDSKLGRIITKFYYQF